MIRRLQRILIANRGEVVQSITKSLHEMGREAIAVYELPDSETLFIRRADAAIPIGAGPLTDYLNSEKIIRAAKEAGADAIHPGYGFLSESAEFAAACRDNGLVFIGPPPEVMRRLGDKVMAKEMMRQERIVTIPGTEVLASGPAGVAEALAFAEAVGYPILLKAVEGGGGRGIREVKDAAHLEQQLHHARREALLAFNDDAVYAEKGIVAPRHVEIQILADAYGKVIHLGSRDCSIQRRHQKLLETAPAAAVPGDIMDAMCRTAVRVARHAGYVNAGTVEFLYDEQQGEFWFMEVNPRLQVEHSVTEMVTGIDIIAKQIEIAEGRPLALEQEDVAAEGCAIHVRVNAEDPGNHFWPEGGKTVVGFRPPAGPGIRLDGVIREGYTVPTVYDSLLVKLTVWGSSWTEAVDRLKEALEKFVIVGLKTTIPFYVAICNEPDFRAGRFDTSYLDLHGDLFDPARHIAANFHP
ncbi:MAG TPA: biotin carboxylase N-terminal domain-containing protein [Syntrophales bacterium]|mgnify:FL=1|nr:biotin carboxylase N-terminal domain-containing protein [Syntrophales bacterium]HOD99302.1 biotin carboxylase N-terminal domain-containing protein [Syntrophales bacterium]HOH74065.1 biotin carboxylase N-terminal domain-containing protein [Syntrophales bacterium]HPN09133.1 biotin carboxylase N-terminal domain-containing protein [Syntrophales bacterium]HPX82436.1 biotin carboxylase N-terminal domain-containing protein [Syntrophales bacterium]